MITETEKEIMVRVSKADFDRSTFRMVTVDKKKGIRQTIGDIKGTDKTETQSFTFDKMNGWTEAAAREWVEKNDFTVKDVSGYVLKRAAEYLEQNEIDLKDIAFFTETNSFEVKEMTSDEGLELFWIKGYLSTYDLDRGSDYVMQGGYEKTNAEHTQLGKFPLLRDHSPTTCDQLGAWVKFQADSKGYYVEGYIVVDDNSRHVVNLIKAGALNTLSAGGIWVYDDPERKEMNGRTETRYPIKDMLIFEGSIVTIPMNPHAQFVAKSYNKGAGVPGRDSLENKFNALLEKLAEDTQISAIIKKHIQGETT